MAINNNGFQIGFNGGSLPPGTPCDSPVYKSFIAGKSAASQQAFQDEMAAKIKAQLTSRPSSSVSYASTPSYSPASSFAPSYSSAPGGSYASPGTVAASPYEPRSGITIGRSRSSRRGPWKSSLIGFVLGGCLGMVLLSTHRAPYGTVFFAQYVLCFAVSFASIFFAITQFRRRRVVSAVVALAAGYFISQHLLPGFSLLAILTHII